VYYYKLEKDGVLHGFLSASDTQPAPWVLISREEFIACGGIDPEPSTVPEPIEDVEALRPLKLSELSNAGNAAIVAGVDVTLPSTEETEHFALEETDQINLSTALTAVERGGAGYPYHANGQLCRMYPAADILMISQAAIQHKLYHTTYCNHLLVWARRAETVEELAGITYGAELPEDLATNMAAVLAAAGGIANA